MSSTGFTEFLHSIVFVFLWSAAVVLSINFFFESVLSYDLSERTRWHILLLVFALLASFFVQLPGTDLTPVSAAGPVEEVVVVAKQPSVTPTPITVWKENQREISALKSKIDKLEAVVVKERKRTIDAESKTKDAERKRTDLNYELQTTKEKWTQDYLTHEDRLRELQTVNNELVDAEERLRDQAETMKRSAYLVTEWKRKFWAQEENARKSRQEVEQCKRELLDTSRKMKKVQREADEREAKCTRVCVKQRTHLDRLVAKEKKKMDEVIEVSPIKAIIDMAPTRPETKTLVRAITTIDLSPISAVSTKPSKEEKTAREISQVGPITATIDLAPTHPHTLTLSGATTTINVSPTTTEATEPSFEEKAAEDVGQGPVTALADILPTPTPTSSRPETKTLVGAVTTTSVFPSSFATEPAEGSTGSEPPAPTISGRIIKKPVSRLNRAAAAPVPVAIPAPVAVPRTPREEVDLLTDMVEMARAGRTEAPPKAALYDIIQQMSNLTNIWESEDPEVVKSALKTLRSLSSGNSIFPLFLRQMTEALCDELEAAIKNRRAEGGVEEEEEDDDEEGDVEMGEGDDDGDEDAESDEDEEELDALDLELLEM